MQAGAPSHSFWEERQESWRPAGCEDAQFDEVCGDEGFVLTPRFEQILDERQQRESPGDIATPSATERLLHSWYAKMKLDWSSLPHDAAESDTCSDLTCDSSSSSSSSISSSSSSSFSSFCSSCSSSSVSCSQAGCMIWALEDQSVDKTVFVKPERQLPPLAHPKTSVVGSTSARTSTGLEADQSSPSSATRSVSPFDGEAAVDNSVDSLGTQIPVEEQFFPRCNDSAVEQQSSFSMAPFGNCAVNKSAGSPRYPNSSEEELFPRCNDSAVNRQLSFAMLSLDNHEVKHADDSPGKQTAAEDEFFPRCHGSPVEQKLSFTMASLDNYNANNLGDSPGKSSSAVEQRLSFGMVLSHTCEVNNSADSPGKQPAAVDEFLYEPPICFAEDHLAQWKHFWTFSRQSSQASDRATDYSCNEFSDFMSFSRQSTPEAENLPGIDEESHGSSLQQELIKREPSTATGEELWRLPCTVAALMSWDGAMRERHGIELQLNSKPSRVEAQGDRKCSIEAKSELWLQSTFCTSDSMQGSSKSSRVEAQVDSKCSTEAASAQWLQSSFFTVNSISPQDLNSDSTTSLNCVHVLGSCSTSLRARLSSSYSAQFLSRAMACVLQADSMRSSAEDGTAQRL